MKRKVELSLLFTKVFLCLTDFSFEPSLIRKKIAITSDDAVIIKHNSILMTNNKENHPFHEVSLAPWHSQPPLSQPRPPSSKQHLNPAQSHRRPPRNALHTITNRQENRSDLSLLKKKMVTIDQDCDRWN